MSFLLRGFGRHEEARAVTHFGGVPSPSEDAMVGLAPEGNAMALAAFYACVTLLADTVASLNLTAYRMSGPVQQALNPQPPFIKQPYDADTSWFAWLWMLMESLAITGNAFGYVTARTPDGKPMAVMPVHPDFVTVEIPGHTSVEWPDPVYRVNGQKVAEEDIIHIKRYPIAGCALGMSPVQKAASAVGLGLSAERYGLNYFRDSANPSSVLESDLPLDDPQTKLLQQQWITSHGGKRRPAILSGGVKWRPIAISPNESQFLETRSYQRSEIAMWFRIPPHMIGDTAKSTSWGTGIEQQSIGFVTYTLRPWLTCIEQAITAMLPRGQFAKFNIDGLLRGDVKTRWEAYGMGRNAGVYSVNDIRTLEDLPAVPDGDGRIQPINFGPLGYEPPTPGPATDSNPPEEDPPADSGDNEESDV